MAERKPVIVVESDALRLVQKGRYSAGGGLYLYVNHATSRSWMFRYAHSLDGKLQQKYVGLGPFPDVSLNQARTRAGELSGQVKALREGSVAAVPSKRQMAREAAASVRGTSAANQKGVRTLRMAVEEWIALRSLDLKNDHHKATLTTQMELHVFPVIGDKPIETVTKRDVADVIRPLVLKAPEVARKTQQRLSATFIREIALDHFEGINPADKKLLDAMGVFAGLAKHEKFAALPYDDVPRLYSTMKARDSLGALCLRFLILTCVRSREVRNACWSEIDLQEKVWVIPAERMKMGREHRVPLTKEALAVLYDASEHKLPKCDLVFPSFSFSVETSKRVPVPMSDMSLLNAVKRLIGCNTTVHGLRSSFRDWVAEKTDHPNHVAEMALAHIVHGVEGAYRRGDLLEKRRALMDDWSAFVTTPAEPFEQVKQVKKKRVAR